jgi:hypothetical protein
MVAVSAAAAWSSGATGMACEAEIDARPRPMANKDTATIFMGIPFCWYTMKMIPLKNALDHLTSGGDASDGGASDGANGDASGGASGHDGASALLPA